MAQGETKNIGQAAAIWIGAVAPTNVKLVWYDTNNNVHRVYNTSTGQWEVLNPQAVTNISLESLTAVATTSGLPIGKFYYLTDIGSLAISITTTKVWYADTHANYVINDLAGSIQHYLNSDNLTIDGKTGVWDSATGKLTFSFNDILNPGQLDKETDRVLIHRGTGSFLKVKLKHLISTATGNSITWNGGLFFNAANFISSIRNIAGGIVGFDRYRTDMSIVTTALSNLATDNNTVRNDCKSYTDEKTADAQIFNKKLKVGISVSPSPANTPAVGWNFYQILGDIYGWFSRLRYGNNVYISANFNANGQSGEINQSDTVATAFQKTVYQLKRLAISDNISLPSNFDGTDAETYTDYPVANNNLTQAIGKLTVKMRELFPRPYINESVWHEGVDTKWIIRNNTLFLMLNKTSRTYNFQEDKVSLATDGTFGLGVDFQDYIQTVFEKIPWTYEDDSVKQKFLNMAYTLNGGSFGLCISHNLSLNTWSADIGYCYGYSTAEPSVEVKFAKAVFQIPLSF